MFTTRLGLENKTQKQEKGRRAQRIPPSPSEGLSTRARETLPRRAAAWYLTWKLDPGVLPEKEATALWVTIPNFQIEASLFPRDGNDLGNQATRAGMGCSVQISPEI